MRAINLAPQGGCDVWRQGAKKGEAGVHLNLIGGGDEVLPERTDAVGVGNFDGNDAVGRGDPVGGAGCPRWQDDGNFPGILRNSHIAVGVDLRPGKATWAADDEQFIIIGG